MWWDEKCTQNAFVYGIEATTLMHTSYWNNQVHQVEHCATLRRASMSQKTTRSAQQWHDAKALTSLSLWHEKRENVNHSYVNKAHMVYHSQHQMTTDECIFTTTKKDCPYCVTQVCKVKIEIKSWKFQLVSFANLILNCLTAILSNNLRNLDNFMNFKISNIYNFFQNIDSTCKHETKETINKRNNK